MHSFVPWQRSRLDTGLRCEDHACMLDCANSLSLESSVKPQNQQQQKGLLQAFQLLLALRKLDPSLAASQSELQLLGIGASLFVEAGILGLAHGAYLKTCLQAFAPTFTGQDALRGSAHAVTGSCTSMYMPAEMGTGCNEGIQLVLCPGKCAACVQLIHMGNAHGSIRCLMRTDMQQRRSAITRLAS